MTLRADMRSASGPVLCRKSILSSSDSTLHGAKTAGLHWGYFLNGGFRSDVASTRKREFDVSKRIITLDAGSLRLLVKFNEITHDAQGFIANRVGFRRRFLRIRAFFVRIEQALVLLPVEGYWTQF